ncbi:caspase family protein [Bradyrhizobium sp. 14AA]
MSARLSLLCVHGVGHAEIDSGFQQSWSKAITHAVGAVDQDVQLTIDFVRYDDLFDKAPLNPLTYAAATAKLLASAVVHGIGDLLPGARGIGDIPAVIKWTAGMVAQWSTDEQLRKDLRQVILDKIEARTYDMVLAHSLGSLICYDTFLHERDAIKDAIFVSFGSQIGNPAVRDVFAGRIQPLTCRRWYHLYNPDDHVLTYPLDVRADNYQQVTVAFDVPNDALNHDATWYLSHTSTVATVWRDSAPTPEPRAIVSAAREMASLAVKPNRRALLIGINDYPDPASRLEGCVNDVFLMSSVLQESGFEPEDIRIVLNDRATTQGIMDRLHWLLDGVRDGDERMLFYSGHGAQIPRYNIQGEPDHVDECLVPYDFDWSPAHAILDRQFAELYSQLPYDSYFVAMLDCCHSGGLTRDGGPRVRGLSPPDDIRHRALKWDAKERMWVPRDFTPLNRSLKDRKNGADFLGQNGATQRLGRAMMLRTKPDKDYDKTRKELDHFGPYMPILLEACQEQQLSYEYRDGVTSYGVYTYSMAGTLRELRAKNENPSFKTLNDLVTAKLKRMRYNQTPNLVGARIRCNAPVPWGNSQGAAPTAPTGPKTSSSRPRKTGRKRAPVRKKTAKKKR